MSRISLTYISTLIIFSLFFCYMTLNYPNHFNQFVNDERIEIISKRVATYSLSRDDY